MNATAMLDTTPADVGFDRAALARAIESCFSCAQTCGACADACLGEEMVAELRRCIRLDLDCADICIATGRMLSRQVAYDHAVTRAMLAACRVVCDACAEECSRHAEMHRHCAVCADACRECAEACAALLGG